MDNLNYKEPNRAVRIAGHLSSSDIDSFINSAVWKFFKEHDYHITRLNLLEDAAINSDSHDETLVFRGMLLGLNKMIEYPVSLRQELKQEIEQAKSEVSDETELSEDV